MADEKILDNEILDDEDLEGVAGGSVKEIVEDRNELTKLGFYKFDKDSGFYGSVDVGFNSLGKKLGLDLKCDSQSVNNASNGYRINNREVTRDEFWSIINEGLAANK